MRGFKIVLLLVIAIIATVHAASDNDFMANLFKGMDKSRGQKISAHFAHLLEKQPDSSRDDNDGRQYARCRVGPCPDPVFG
uniref:Uncharacterized protein n=1 Tax=Panagrellus redivivus TaxID=6233 RepID=A0A7E4V7N1_PANRE